MSNFDLVWVYVNTRPRLRAHMPGRASQHAPPSPSRWISRCTCCLAPRPAAPVQRREDGRARAVVGVVIEDDHLARDGQRAIGKLLGGAPLLRALVRLDVLEELALGGVARARAALVALVRGGVRVRVRVGVSVRGRVRVRVRVRGLGLG